MFKLSYGTHLGKKKIIGKYETVKEAKAEMVKRLEDEGINPRYYRQVGENENCFIDFGSWSYYYFIEKID